MERNLLSQEEWQILARCPFGVSHINDAGKYRKELIKLLACMCVYIYMYALEFFEILKSNKSPYMRKFSKSYGSTPNLIGTRDQFCGRQFFHGPGFGVGMDLG